VYVFGGKLLVLSALARAMTKKGYRVHVSHVSRVFHGERPPTKEFVDAVAKVLGMSRSEANRLIEQAVEATKEFNRMPKLVEEG